MGVRVRCLLRKSLVSKFTEFFSLMSKFTEFFRKTMKKSPALSLFEGIFYGYLLRILYLLATKRGGKGGTVLHWRRPLEAFFATTGCKRVDTDVKAVLEM